MQWDVPSGQQTICDYVAGAAPASSTYRYVYASYIDEPVMRWQTTGGVRVYYHRNQQYSITALTSHNGSILERYAYTAYGVPTITNGSGAIRSASAHNNRYTHTGREWDSDLRLYHYRARMYDPSLGRFCSRDPIGYGGKDANIYRFLKATPLLRTDPFGLYPCFEPYDAGILFGNLIDEQGVSGMPWRRKQLPPGVYGHTDFELDPICECEECCDGFYLESVGVDMDIWIELDLNQGIPWNYLPPPDASVVEGVYGHEQRHVLNLMRLARDLYQGQLSPLIAGALGNRGATYSCGKPVTTKKTLVSLVSAFRTSQSEQCQPNQVADDRRSSI